jgi:hypothetical protein
MTESRDRRPADPDLGALSGALGALFARKSFDIDRLEPLWAQIQPYLRGLEPDDIREKVASWAGELELPIVETIPAGIVEEIRTGVPVPLARLIRG